MNLDSRTMMSLLENGDFTGALEKQSETDKLAAQAVAQIKHLNGYQRISPHYEPNWNKLRGLLEKYLEAHPKTIKTYLPEGRQLQAV